MHMPRSTPKRALILKSWSRCCRLAIPSLRTSKIPQISLPVEATVPFFAHLAQPLSLSRLAAAQKGRQIQAHPAELLLQRHVMRALLFLQRQVVTVVRAVEQWRALEASSLELA